jgi:hypothetical protein
MTFKKSELRTHVEPLLSQGRTTSELRDSLYPQYKDKYPDKHKFYQLLRTISTKYKKTQDRIEPPYVQKSLQPTKSEPSVAEKVRAILKRRQVSSLTELSNEIDISIGKVEIAISELIETGYNISVENGNVLFTNIIPKSETTHLSIPKMSTGFHRFGAIGDNHLCSRYERMDILNAIYDLYEAEGIKVVYNTGNWIDGEARFNKHDLHTHGMDNQINYFLKNYPQRNGITTYFITGDDHEGWYTQREGIDVGRYTQMKAQDAGRNDLIYIGHMEADVAIKAPDGETIIRVAHPGGGSAYAVSYTGQKIVESYSAGEKPHILLIGHYHKAEYLFNRGVHIVQTSTTQDQSPFMRKKRLSAHLGGWIIEFANDDNGAITRFKSEFLPFYDNAYYTKWAYKWQ